MHCDFSEVNAEGMKPQESKRLASYAPGTELSRHPPQGNLTERATIRKKAWGKAIFYHSERTLFNWNNCVSGCAIGAT